MKQQQIYVPKVLCSWALSNKRTQQLKLYEYLKMSCSGKRRISKPFVKKACKDLSIHRSTFYRLLQWLREHKWVSKSNRSQLYFILGHEKLLQQKNLKGNTTARFQLEWLDSFKAFCCGLVVGYLVKHQRKAERKKGRSNKLYPVATKALSKILDIPKSTAFHYKQQATEEGFISKERRYKNTGIHIKYLEHFKKVNTDIAHKVVGNNDCICVCMPNEYEDHLKYSSLRV